MSVPDTLISVLYADDDPVLLELTKEVLVQDGQIAVDTASSAIEALDLLQKTCYDCIISDYQMPEMDGIEFLQSVRARYPDIPFILFTGKGREEIVIQAINAGADCYVQKGTDARSQFLELTQRLKQAVGKRRTERALRASEERYRNVVEDQTEFICRFLPDGTHVFVNDAYCRYFGMQRTEIVGHRFIPEIPESDRGLIRSYFISLTRDEPVRTIEHRVVLPDGSMRWQQWSDRAIFDEAGQLVEFQSVGRDITERKTAEQDLLKKNEELFAAYEQLTAIEEELRTSFNDLAKSQRTLENREATLDAVIHESPIPQFVIDKNHTILYWNHALSVYSRIDARDVVGTDQHWRAFYPTQHPCLADLIMDNQIEKIAEWYGDRCVRSSLIEDAYEATGFFPSLGEEGKWLHFLAGLIRDRNGEVIGAVETLEDITELKLREAELARNHEELNASYELLAATEEELRQNYDEILKKERDLFASEERYRDIVEDQTEFISRFLPDGTHIFVNDAYCRYFGFVKEDILGRRFLPRIPNDDRALLASHLRSLTPQHPVATIEHRIIMHDGAVRWQQWSDRAIFDSSGSVVEYQSVGRDVTDRKLAEIAAREASRKLQLLSGITRHDIQNQLTALMTDLDLLAEYLPNKAFGDRVARAEKTATTIGSLIAFTREYGSLGQNAPQWHRIENVFSAIASGLDLSRLRLTIDHGNLEVYADPMFERVFYNIVDNTLRYGENATEIRLRWCRSDDGVTLICEDNGIGIPRQEKEKIFERGYGRNTGLGLFLVREILSITGVRIRETGDPGRGARFEIQVPDGAFRFQDPEVITS